MSILRASAPVSVNTVSSPRPSRCSRQRNSDRAERPTDTDTGFGEAEMVWVTASMGQRPGGCQRHRRWSQAFVTLLTLVAAVVIASAASGAQVRSGCGGPAAVSGSIVRDFAPPPHRYGAGHRGIKVAVEDGALIHATQSGSVRFVGMVAGTPWVSLQQADGTIATFGGVSGVGLSAGELVSVGDVVAAAQSSIVHVGLRSGEDYLDPIGLLGGTPATISLTRWGGDLGPPPEVCRVLEQVTNVFVAVVNSAA
ncbi:MAG: M23 family metallopeptidase [Actinobacteria bacterium]|nr:M23 family metallopeptidase [Actinomycetota bacterium]MCB9388111.1 M23 family metallopeptidase [Acidimicrobiia bacterium]